ncbi:hypothetical protein PG996_004926 [Apiospora saccharicola]|uniref:Uncharacterized protein n=1 Tax=Apiospora saccharicola TaxID=335842 RepID=A0ABR1VK18_9PEZI
MSGDSIYEAGGQLEGVGAGAAAASDETGASPRRICSGDVRADPSLDETLVEKAISEGIISPDDGAKWIAAFDFANWGRQLRKEAESMRGLRVILSEVEGEYDEYEVDWETYRDPYYVDDTRICPVIV